MKSRAHARILAGSLAVVASCAGAGNGLAVPPGEWVWPQVQVRITVQSTALSPLPGSLLARQEARSVPYGLQGGALLGDVVLARPSYGIFRATSGVLLGQAGGAPVRDAALGGGIGLNLLEGAPGVHAGGAGPATQPYLGLGYSSPAVWGGFSLTADVGMTAGGMGGVGRALLGQQALDLALREMRVTPLLQFGLRYAF